MKERNGRKREVIKQEELVEERNRREGKVSREELGKILEGASGARLSWLAMG